MGKAGVRSPRSSRTISVTQWPKISREELRAYGSYNKPYYHAMSGGKEELKDNVSLILKSNNGGVSRAERGRKR